MFNIIFLKDDNPESRMGRAMAGWGAGAGQEGRQGREGRLKVKLSLTEPRVSRVSGAGLPAEPPPWTE